MKKPVKKYLKNFISFKEKDLVEQLEGPVKQMALQDLINDEKTSRYI